MIDLTFGAGVEEMKRELQACGRCLHVSRHRRGIGIGWVDEQCHLGGRGYEFA